MMRSEKSDVRLLNIRAENLVLDADAIDISAFEAQLSAQEQLRRAFEKQERVELGADLFTSLYRLRPTMKNSPPAPVRARLIDQAMQTSAYHKLHSHTALDDVLSAAGTLALEKYLAEAPQEIKDALKHEDNALELQEKAQALAELARETNNAKLQKQAESLAQQAQSAQQQALDTLNKISEQSVKEHLAKAMQNTSQNIENAEQFASGWGSEPGVLQKFLFDEKLSKMLSGNKIKKILDLAGRMREVIASERAKRPLPAPDEVDVTMGNDVLNTIPSELALLADESTEDIFYRKYLERSLLQFERLEKPKLGKGPFIVCIDESGSMEGIKEEWAKALAFALMAQARVERRTFGAVAFSAKGHIRTVFRPTPNDLLDFMSRFFNGGTDFYEPLKTALQMIENCDLREDADIIFVTDGEAALSQEELREITDKKGELGVKVISIQIGTESLEGLRPFSDRVFRLVAERGTDGLEAIIAELK